MKDGSVYRDLGVTIAKRRSELGLLQKEVARAAGMKRALYGHVETGRYRVQVADLGRIASVLKCRLVLLFEPLETN